MLPRFCCDLNSCTANTECASTYCAATPNAGSVCTTPGRCGLAGTGGGVTTSYRWCNEASSSTSITSKVCVGTSWTSSDCSDNPAPYAMCGGAVCNAGYGSSCQINTLAPYIGTPCNFFNYCDSSVSYLNLYTYHVCSNGACTGIPTTYSSCPNPMTSTVPPQARGYCNSALNPDDCAMLRK